MARVSAEDRIETARNLLLWDHPFFVIVSFSMIWVEQTDPSNPSFKTDGRMLWWNRDYVEMLDPAELIFIVLKMLYHKVLGHHYRRGQRHKRKWNRACSYAVVQELVDLKVGKRRPEMPYAEEFKNLNAEEIYNRLPDQDDGDGGGEGDNPPPPEYGEVIDAEDIPDAEVENEITIKQAIDAARKNPGKVPGGIRRLIQDLDEPKMDWRSILHRFMSAGSMIDYSWQRPSRRTLSMGLHLPGQIKDGINHIVFCIDTSGSVDQAALKLIVSEMAGAFYSGLIDRISVIYCDAAVQAVEEFEQGDIITCDAKGGGGTSFAPSMWYVRKHYPEAQAVIYFTDMYCNDFGPKPDCPVMWAIFGPKKSFRELSRVPPFGECIHVED